MTAPAFGSNDVGGAAAPCPLGNLNFKVTQRPDGLAPTCEVKLAIAGPKSQDGSLAAGFKQGGFLHIPPGQYTVSVLAEGEFIDCYELPTRQTAVVPQGGSVTVEFQIDPFADVVVTVTGTDGKPIGGEVDVRLTRAGGTRTEKTQVARAKFDLVRAGVHEVTVVVPPELAKRYRAPATAVSVSVTAGQKPAPVEVKLTPLPWIELAAVDEGGRKITGLSVTIKGPSGAVAQGNSPDRATVRVEGLEPGANPCAVDEMSLVGDEVWAFVKVS